MVTVPFSEYKKAASSTALSAWLFVKACCKLQSHMWNRCPVVYFFNPLLTNSLIFRRSAHAVNTTYSTSRKHMKGCRQKTKVSLRYHTLSAFLIFFYFKAMLYSLAIHKNIRTFSFPSFSILSDKAAWTIHHCKSRCRG